MSAKTLKSRFVPINVSGRLTHEMVSFARDHEHQGEAIDTFARPLRDLRISVIDQCNFRCSYCMPKSVFGKDYQFLSKNNLLSVVEIESLARAFVNLGVRKIRITGGEPLLRKELPEILRGLSNLRTVQSEELDIALTTNGSLLAKRAASLRQAGLKRVTVSLDALDDHVFKAMNDVDFPVASVLEGIDEAIHQGLSPLKVNMVVKRGENDNQVIPMAGYFREHYGATVSLRFIEFMDVGHSNDWKMDKVVPSRELVQALNEHFPMKPVDSSKTGETAERWTYLDGLGDVGFISSVTQPFCGDCCRARLSADGQLYTCLFAQSGFDLSGWLRATTGSSEAIAQADPERLERQIQAIWSLRRDRYSDSRSLSRRTERSKRVEMHYIGG